VCLFMWVCVGMKYKDLSVGCLKMHFGVWFEWGRNGVCL